MALHSSVILAYRYEGEKHQRKAEQAAKKLGLTVHYNDYLTGFACDDGQAREPYWLVHCQKLGCSELSSLDKLQALLRKEGKINFFFGPGNTVVVAAHQKSLLQRELPGCLDKIKSAGMRVDEVTSVELPLPMHARADAGVMRLSGPAKKLLDEKLHEKLGVDLQARILEEKVRVRPASEAN